MLVFGLCGKTPNSINTKCSLSLTTFVVDSELLCWLTMLADWEATHNTNNDNKLFFHFPITLFIIFSFFFINRFSIFTSGLATIVNVLV